MRGLLTRTFWCFMIAWAAVSPVSAETETGWYLEPTLGVTVATRLHEPDHLTEQANFFALKTEYHSERLRFLFDGEARYDSVFDLQDNYSQATEDAYRLDGTLHRAVVGWAWADWDVSLGYQKVAWGEADDLRIVDVVNPLDFKNFVLFDLNDYRIAQNMLRVEGPLADSWELEVLWIFRFEGNDYPPPGSEFAFAGMPDARRDDPRRGEVGIRANTALGGADLSFYGFQGYEDAPIYSVEKSGLTALHEPMTMAGVSFSAPVLSWVVRGDAACFPERHIGRDDGTVSRNTMVSGLLGLDYLYRDWIFGFQVTDRHIEDWSDELVEEQHDTYGTASAEGNVLSGKLTARFAYTLSRSYGGGGLSQVKLTYRPDRHWTARFAVDVMDGDRRNVFGQFSPRDRIWMSMAYTF